MCEMNFVKPQILFRAVSKNMLSPHLSSNIWSSFLRHSDLMSNLWPNAGMSLSCLGFTEMYY